MADISDLCPIFCISIQCIHNKEIVKIIFHRTTSVENI